MYNRTFSVVDLNGVKKIQNLIDLHQVGDSNFNKSTVVITESITINDANTVTGVAHIVTNQAMLTVDDSVTITIGEGKTLIPDVYNIFDK